MSEVSQLTAKLWCPTHGLVEYSNKDAETHYDRFGHVQMYIPVDIVRLLQKPIAILERRNAELVKALRTAVDTIRAFNGIGMPPDAAARLWEWYQQSPEMKIINAALSTAPNPEPQVCEWRYDKESHELSVCSKCEQISNHVLFPIFVQLENEERVVIFGPGCGLPIHIVEQKEGER